MKTAWTTRQVSVREKSMWNLKKHVKKWTNKSQNNHILINFFKFKSIKIFVLWCIRYVFFANDPWISRKWCTCVIIPKPQLLKANSFRGLWVSWVILCAHLRWLTVVGLLVNCMVNAAMVTSQPQKPSAGLENPQILLFKSLAWSARECALQMPHSARCNAYQTTWWD